MIAYNKLWLQNLELHEELNAACQSGCVTNDEVKAIKSKYPVGFYTPVMFIRIGLFILTFIVTLFTAGIFSLMFAGTHIVESFGWLLFLGLASYAVLEIIIKEKKHYKSGVDDALLLLAAGFLIAGFAWMVYAPNASDQHDQYLKISLFVLILSAHFTLRFTNLLMSAIACLSFLSFIFFSWQNLGTFGMSTMPFVMMLMSALIYNVAAAADKRIGAHFYGQCIIIVKVISLAALYAAGNYFIIDKLNSQLNGSIASANVIVPFGIFFWIWTMLLPLLFIGWGIYKKSAIFLRLGLVLIACSVLTFRNYYHVMPTELALILAGIILLVIVYGIIKYLKGDKYGFTYADINQVGLLDRIKLESLIIGEALGHAPVAAKPNERFGGGDFGGGGSGGAF